MRGVVLVHGGQHGSWAWDRLRPYLDMPSVAVELHGRDPEDDALPGLVEHAEVALEQIQRCGFDRVILVGHSLAGLVIREVAGRRPDLVEHLVFVSAVVAPEGKTLRGIMPWWSRPLLRGPGLARGFALPEPIARLTFCNGLRPNDSAYILSRLAAEPLGRLASEPMPCYQLGSTVPQTYVKLLRDRALPPRRQDAMIRNLDSPAVIDFDTGHEVMFAEPARLACMINNLFNHGESEQGIGGPP